VGERLFGGGRSGPGPGPAIPAGPSKHRRRRRRRRRRPKSEPAQTKPPPPLHLSISLSFLSPHSPLATRLEYGRRGRSPTVPALTMPLMVGRGLRLSRTDAAGAILPQASTTAAPVGTRESRPGGAAMGRSPPLGRRRAELAEAVEVAVEVALLRPGGAWAEAAEEKAAGAPRHSAARARRGGTRRRGEGMAEGKEMSVGAGGRGRGTLWFGWSSGRRARARVSAGGKRRELG
jgi:hypothetical protein